MQFLAARWSRLAMCNYAIEPERLAAFLPLGCVADTSLDGQAYVSLVAFDFERVRVLGLPWRNFPEVNLRAYVRHTDSGDRGVVFVRELVPYRIVAAVARWLYNEPYVAASMTSKAIEVDGSLHLAHAFRLEGAEHRLAVWASPACRDISETAAEHWFKEHRWGFNRMRSGKLIRYEVSHPRWRCHTVQRYQVGVNFGKLYGPAWADLTGKPPNSVLLAEGSAVSVSVWRPER